MTRAVRTAQFGCSSLRTSATYKESKEARLSLIPYRTRKSEKMSGNGGSRGIDLVWPGIDSKKAGQVTMSKERFFVARKGKGIPQNRQPPDFNSTKKEAPKQPKGYLRCILAEV